jgi:hypothetical protein
VPHIQQQPDIRPALLGELQRLVHAPDEFVRTPQMLSSVNRYQRRPKILQVLSTVFRRPFDQHWNTGGDLP